MVFFLFLFKILCDIYFSIIRRAIDNFTGIGEEIFDKESLIKCINSTFDKWNDEKRKTKEELYHNKCYYYELEKRSEKKLLN